MYSCNIFRIRNCRNFVFFEKLTATELKYIFYSHKLVEVVDSSYLIFLVHFAFIVSILPSFFQSMFKNLLFLINVVKYFCIYFKQTNQSDILINLDWHFAKERTRFCCLKDFCISKGLSGYYCLA